MDLKSSTRMDKERQILFELKNKKPQLIYIAGKTSTGKTTLSNILCKEMNYHVLELDRVVKESIIDFFQPQDPHVAFAAAYRGEGPQKYTDTFITRAQKNIKKEIASNSMIVEGAIHTREILQSLFAPFEDMLCVIFLHPTNPEKYHDRIIKRLYEEADPNKHGKLPNTFWSHVSEKDTRSFFETGEINEGIKMATREYVKESMEESERRLHNFQSVYPDIMVVEV
jgi:guanylate kinase